MPDEKSVYLNHAIEYDALISREDYQGNLLKSIRQIVSLDGLDVLDLGSGTGRLAYLLAPHVRSISAFDLSSHMLELARNKLDRFKHEGRLVAIADHRFLPLKHRCADLMVSGWSVSYLSVWNPIQWREAANAWLHEASRVLRPNGCIILFESLGTGNETPQRLPHLENFHRWLDETGFRNTWIRTDYRFTSMEEAGRLAGFFFGDEMRQKIMRERSTILPECTGIWWTRY